MKPISEELLSKPRKKKRTPDCAPEGNSIAPTHKAQGKRVKDLEGRKPPRRFRSKTPRCAVDAMDWMLSSPPALPKKRRGRKSVPDGAIEHSIRDTIQPLLSSGIPDLNELSTHEEIHTSPVPAVRKRRPRK